MRPPRRILRAKRGKLTEVLRFFLDNELHKFYFSPDIIRMMNSRTGYAGHIENAGKKCLQTFDKNT
jgi:hypothetical protein